MNETLLRHPKGKVNLVNYWILPKKSATRAIICTIIYILYFVFISLFHLIIYYILNSNLSSFYLILSLSCIFYFTSIISR